MKKIDIICILDMSGSMCSIIEKAREGFNGFLNEQKLSENEIKFWLMFFDDNHYMPYNGVNIKKVKKLTKETYYDCGSTSLYDAIGFCAENYLDYLASKSKEKRADKTLFVIQTDGFENSSRVYHKEYIKNMVTHLQEVLNIGFLYLGANQDSCFVADSMGINSSNAFNYTHDSDGITIAYANIAKATKFYSENDVKDNLFQQ